MPENNQLLTKNEMMKNEKQASVSRLIQITVLSLSFLLPGISTPIFAQATERLSSYVNTLRGSDSNAEFSRGNNPPLTTMPNGHTFWTAVTNAESRSEIYEWPDSSIQGFGASHIPSIWIGDYSSIFVMPEIGPLQFKASDRGASFTHANEKGMAHYYSVLLDNGIKVEMAPTMHTCVMRFTFPESDDAHILFDSRNKYQGFWTDIIQGEINIDTEAGVVSGWTDDHNTEMFSSAPNLYFYATFDKQFASYGFPEEDSGICANIDFATIAGEEVVMKMGVSFYSIEQAALNLSTEVGEKTFDEIREEGAVVWDNLLGKIEVEGATDEQLITFYSCLYRSYAYPNDFSETIDGRTQYFCPVGDNVFRDGKFFTNNGFWDTYKAAWPLYSIVTPTQTGVMLDGYIDFYHVYGSVPRWLGPGNQGAMISSHSDALFADAYVKGITNFDYNTAFETMLKNANTSQGMRDNNNHYSIFKGYYPIEEKIHESAAWSLENQINDAFIARMALALGDMDGYKYFSNRAKSYTVLFSPSVKFFRGRNKDGSWRTKDSDFKPYTWGYEYTEGCAWHYRVAPLADGQGLANLFGGRDKLKEAIDEIFDSPNTVDGGSYGLIHEMLEMQAGNMGQYNHANQADHGTIFMYNYAAAPYRSAEKSREVCTRLYNSGLNRGDGYPGDEDNGSMSAWYVLAASGFFPASGATSEYLIGSPLFTRITYHLENGKDFVISAPGNSTENIYIQSATLNGEAYTKNYFTHADIVNGSTLELTMGSSPGEWGTGENDVPTSLTVGSVNPEPEMDCTTEAVSITGSGKGLSSASDNDPGTGWLTAAKSAWIQYEFPFPVQINMYTITNASLSNNRDPKTWQLQASNDTVNWVELDSRQAEYYTWKQETRYFAFDNSESYKFYRLNISENNSDSYTQIAEIELFNADKKPLQSTWRWRKDDGNESNASWLADEMKGFILDDTTQTLRLRIRVDNLSGQDIPFYRGLVYATTKPASDLGLRYTRGTEITEDTVNAAFKLVESKFVTDNETSEQLSGFTGSALHKALVEGKTFIAGLFYLPGFDPVAILTNNVSTEVEYCIKATKNIQTDIVYYFWLNSASAEILDSQSIPSLKTNIPDTGNSVDDNLHSEGITIFPNPVKNQVNIHFNNDYTGARVSIIDETGRILSTHNAAGTDLSLDFGKMLAGLYYLQVEHEDERTLFKIVK